MSQTYKNANELLRTAGEIVNSDRKADYGDAMDSFKSIAGFWTQYLRSRRLLSELITIEASDVAMMMDLLKTSRFATGGFKPDTFVDKCGYAALGGAIARIETEPK